MIKFIEEKTGSYQDKKWQLEYYEQFKTIGLDEIKPRKLSSANQSSSSKSNDITLKEIAKLQAKNRILTENGDQLDQ